MKMKKFMNYEESELLQFIGQDNVTIEIRFITESDSTTKVYYNEYKRNVNSIFGSSVFASRQSMIQYDPSSIFRGGETPVSAHSQEYHDRVSGN
jgi:hypothetical protein